MIAYHVDVARRIAITRVSGQLTFSDLANHLHRLLRDPKFSADYDGLIIASDVAAVPSLATCKAFLPLVRAWAKRRVGVRWAFVLPTNETRAFAESTLMQANFTGITSRCFSSEGAALAWLESADSASRPAPAAMPALRMA